MATSGPDVAALVALQQAALQTIAACEQRGQGVAALQTLLPTSLASDNQAQQQHESDTMSEQRTENDGGTGSMPGDGTTPPGRGGSGSASQQLALTPTQFRAPTKDGKEEYLYLSHTFVHQKLRAFVPPCPVEVQLEVNGQVQPAVYPGQLQDSTAKGFYCLDAPPKELVAGQDITGIRLKTDGRIAIQVQPRKRPLASDEGRRRLNPRVIGITTSIRVDFLKQCFAKLEEPRHPVNIRVEINGVRQLETFNNASVSHNKQGSYYVLGLPFALVHGRAFVAWRHLEGDVLELAVQDVDPILMAASAPMRSPDVSSATHAFMVSSGARKAAPTGIIVDSRISIPLAMLKRDLGHALAELLPGGVGPSFEIPIPVKYRVDGEVLPRLYGLAVIKKSEHRGCCYLNGTERIPVKSKMLTGLELQDDNKLCVLNFTTPQEDGVVQRRHSPAAVQSTGRSARPAAAATAPPVESPAAAPAAAATATPDGATNAISALIRHVTTGAVSADVAAQLAQALTQASQVAAAAEALVGTSKATPPSTTRRNKRAASTTGETTEDDDSAAMETAADAMANFQLPLPLPQPLFYPGAALPPVFDGLPMATPRSPVPTGSEDAGDAGTGTGKARKGRGVRAGSGALHINGAQGSAHWDTLGALPGAMNGDLAPAPLVGVPAGGRGSARKGGDGSAAGADGFFTPRSNAGSGAGDADDAGELRWSTRKKRSTLAGGDGAAGSGGGGGEGPSSRPASARRSARERSASVHEDIIAPMPTYPNGMFNGNGGLQTRTPPSARTARGARASARDRRAAAPADDSGADGSDGMGEDAEDEDVQGAVSGMLMSRAGGPMGLMMPGHPHHHPQAMGVDPAAAAAAMGMGMGMGYYPTPMHMAQALAMQQAAMVGSPSPAMHRRGGAAAAAGAMGPMYGMGPLGPGMMPYGPLGAPGMLSPMMGGAHMGMPHMGWDAYGGMGAHMGMAGGDYVDHEDDQGAYESEEESEEEVEEERPRGRAGTRRRAAAAAAAPVRPTPTRATARARGGSSGRRGRN